MVKNELWLIGRRRYIKDLGGLIVGATEEIFAIEITKASYIIFMKILIGSCQGICGDIKDFY